MTDEIELIDLNQADAERLTTLPGIGMGLAKRIIEYRESVHPFEEVIELAAVPGISERTVRNFEDRVTVITPALMEATTAEGLAELVETRSPESEMEPEASVLAEPDAEQAIEAEQEDEAELASAAALDTTEELDSAPAPPTSSREREPVYRPVVADQLDSRDASRDEQEKRAQRRGCFALVAGAVLGAVVGAILSLAVLAGLNNGTLSFSQVDARLGQELNRARQAQGELDEQLGAVEAQANELATRAVMLAQQQEAADASLAELEETIAGVEREIDKLESVTTELDERLTGVAAAAETFNTFLNSLRDLLFDLQGPPPTPMPTATPTDTPAPEMTTTPEASEEVAPETTPTSDGPVTRTPRPTATILSFPTSTPEPQP